MLIFRAYILLQFFKETLHILTKYPPKEIDRLKKKMLG